MMADGNGWSEWQNHILLELKRLSKGVETLKDSNDEDHEGIRSAVGKNKEELLKEINKHKTETATDLATVKAEIKYKSGVWGAIVAFLTTLGGLLLYIFLVSPK